MRRRTTALAATYLLAACSAGCVVVSWFSGPKRDIPFSHATHAREEIACIACHSDAESENRAGMPDKEVCLTCHGPKTDRPPKPYEEKIAQANPLTFPRWNKSPDVVFSHSKHIAKGYECQVCHGKVEETGELDAGVVANMDGCIACHAKDGIKNDCATCHSALRLDVKPASHDAGFMRTHGRSLRAASNKLEESRCLICHGPASMQSCERCHAEVLPASHTVFWRQRGHGFSAEIDRESCMPCHRDDSCMRCPQQVQPSTHVGAWGGTISTHCLSCHAPPP